MKLPINYFVVIFFIQISLYAQKLTNAQLDSTIIVIKEAYNLSQQSKYADAIKVSNTVFDYAELHKNDFLKAKALNVLGISYNGMGELGKSLNYFSKAKILFEKIKDTSKIIVVNNNLGVLYHSRGEYKTSNSYFEIAMETAEQSENYNAAIYPAFNIGHNLIYEKEDFTEGIKFLNRVLQLTEKAKEVKYERIKTDTYQDLGYAYYKLKNKDQSILYYDKATKMAEENKLLESLQIIYQNKIELYEEGKQYKKANQLLYKLIKINDSITKVTNYEKVKQIEAEYFIKENKNKLMLSENEKASQQTVIDKTRIYNIVLIIFSCILLLNVYWIFKKNKELNIAKEKAENLSKIKSDFYSEISHELRTPLYAVIELSGLLLKENVNVKHKEYLESLKFSANHLLSLINNVLQLNKIESGKMKIQELDFNLKNLITSIIESLEYALNDSNNKIHLDYDNSIPSPIIGDSLKLSQVLINLISNAIKFTNNGNVRVGIKCIEDTKDSITILFKVSDDGIGISKEIQKQIFVDFYQEHAKNDKSYKGTGLGLSIVKRIVVAMGSDVKVDSVKNVGTSFFFELVFDKKEKSDSFIGLCSQQLESVKNKKILIVDDNKINQIVTKKILEEFSLKVRCVSGGYEAIELIKQEEFDCILMDLHMPDIDGFETAEKIRVFNVAIPIIALTAAALDEVENKIKASEINGYVLKPFVTTEFLHIICNVIKKHSF